MHSYSEISPGPRETEETPEFSRLVALYGYWSPIDARGYARVMGHPTFPGGCPIHGEVIGSTATGACIQCSGHLRRAAQAEGAPTYRHHCYDCAETTVHRTTDEKCLECLPRRSTTGARAEARRQGLPTYMDRCTACRTDTAHSVALGKCTTCYTTAGAARVRPTGNPRAEARNAGAKTYVATCWLHGATNHSVAHGKCLECFNAMGEARPAMKPPKVKDRNHRAEARNAGRLTFTFYCEECNDDVAHRVSHGKCTTCCTTGGTKRIRKAPAYRERDDFAP